MLASRVWPDAGHADGPAGGTEELGWHRAPGSGAQGTGRALSHRPAPAGQLRGPGSAASSAGALRDSGAGERPRAARSGAVKGLDAPRRAGTALRRWPLSQGDARPQERRARDLGSPSSRLNEICYLVWKWKQNRA